MKKINHRKKAIIYAAFMTVFLIGVYTLGILIPEEAVKGSFINAKLPPCFEYPFGTDALGRDLFLRTVKGLSVSITVGIAASAISAVIAVFMGAAAATGSKRLDALINWIIDLVMGIPHTILIILISFSLGRGLKGLLAGIAATHWCSLARLIRAEVLQLRSRQYIAISKKLGKSGWWILRNHLLPHLVPQLLTGLILMFPHAILHEAAVSFLGFGLPPEQSAIGIILAESMRYLSVGMWWPAVLPGLTLVCCVLAIDKLGNSLDMLTSPYGYQE